MNNKSHTPPWLEGIEGEFLPPLISSNSPVIRVVAGPGSGKTTGLKRRVQRLIQGDEISPAKIFIGTFTRAITQELADELGVSATSEKSGTREPEPSIQVSTLHSHALELIRGNPTARPGRVIRFLLEYEKSVMLYDLGEIFTETKQKQRQDELKRVSAAWAEGADLEIAAFVGEMNRWLLRHEGMLIDEVVNLARTGLESGSIPAGTFDHVVIDEYQDLTAAEQKLIEKLWSRKGSLVVLGDDDQSIYAFRYNHPGGITEFVLKWEKDDLEDLGIPENRRCGKVIVDLANAMMAEAGSKKAPMIPKQKYDGELSLIYWQSLAQEIRGLAIYMRHQKHTRFLVLVPRRFIGYRLQEQIGDDALTSFQEEALELPLVQERFAPASLIANPEDRVALRTLLAFHSNGVENGPERNAKAYRSLLDCELSGSALLEAIVRGDVKTKGSGQSHVIARAGQVHEFMRNCSKDHEEAISALFDPELASQIEEEEKQRKARRDLAHLRDSAILVARESKEGTELKSILEKLRYRIATRIPLTEVENARVRIMTLHGAKGLEADVVVVAGMADEIIPGFLSGEPGEAEKVKRGASQAFICVCDASEASTCYIVAPHDAFQRCR